MIAVLFVCMGNICRSPLAEGAFRRAVTDAELLEVFCIDSAGTIGYHEGNPPDTRSQRAAATIDIDISGQRSRKVRAQDFEKFDYIIAMDRDNEANLLAMCPSEHQHKISMFLPYAPHLQSDEMPDPYYGHERDFMMCLDAATDAAEGLLATIRQEKLQG